MSKSLLILTPNPDHPSHHGRWPYVLDAYREALSGIDVEIFDQPWSEAVTGTPDLIVPLVAWGYHNDPDGFRTAMAELTTHRMFNPPEIVRWNVDKRYLRDLAQAGVRIIPTQFVERLTQADITQARADFGDTLVLKPVVSAGAKDTVVWGKAALLPCDSGGGGREADGGGQDDTAFAGQPDVEGKQAQPPQGPAMIQPFMESIRTEGEWSLIYFAGQFSHAVLKTPKSGDFRSQPDYDAHLRVETPPPEALDLAQAALEVVGADSLLYARADMVRDDQGRFCLMELELIEPDLYLSYDLEASLRFKDAVEQALHIGCACHEKSA